MKDGIHPNGYAVTNKQTNADRIRSMTDEELAMAIMCPAEFTGSDKVLITADPTFGRGIKQFGGTFATISGSA